jgi:hypothetical protein
MEIKLTKNPTGDHVLSCKRNNGTITWKHVSSFFISHDICHYAAEAVIPLNNVFFGMVAAGTDIENFDLPKEQRNFQLTEEAILAEHLVNLLTIEVTQGKLENFLEVFSGIYEEHVGTKLYRGVTENKLEEIRNKLTDLLQQWNLLEETKTMTLLFKE